MRQKLTVLIPCKDEASQIASCIASLGNVADEILIADSGSTDGTLQCVEKFTQKKNTYPDHSTRVHQSL
ncbi:MAG: hypothetical protein CMJ74_02825 [Planctomycetaceae bacterium]|nr:hypothetical protein [Planctomycetaceae bacterium]